MAEQAISACSDMPALTVDHRRKNGLLPSVPGGRLTSGVCGRRSAGRGRGCRGPVRPPGPGSCVVLSAVSGSPQWAQAGPRGGVMAAVQVVDAGRRPGRAGIPTVAPVHQGEQHGVQILAFGGRPVVLAGRALLVPLADDDVLLDQPGQPGREDLTGDPEIVDEVIEPGDPVSTSRMISAVHASPNRSVARAIEQATSASGVRVTLTAYPRSPLRNPPHVKFPKGI